MDYGGAHGHTKPSTSNNKRVGSKPLVSHVNLDHSRGIRPDPNTNLKGIKQGSARNSDSPDTASSSSSASSSDNYFQVNPQILPKFRVQNNIPKPSTVTKPLYKNEKFDVSSEALYRLEESINDSPVSTSQFSDVTYESLAPYTLPTLSPPMQMMERPGDFDPNRIPASIFSRASTPTEWSIASNDSLFSIRIGNNSFSREHAERIGVDLYKSGELPKSGELFKSGELCLSSPFKSGELCQEPDKSRELYESGENFNADDLKVLKQITPTTKKVEINGNLDMGKTVGEDVKRRERGVIDEPTNDVAKALMNNQVHTKTRDAYSANRQSDQRDISIQTLVLPKKKKSSCPLCHCTSCCHLSCCCKWPSCKKPACSCKWIRWPSCSFKWLTCWPSCCLGNCFSSKKSCCCKWPSCHCRCPTWSSCCSCKCSSWPSYCKCPSWPSCKCTSCSSCKCLSCPSWKCSWPSCKCQGSHCSWACCYCCDSSKILTDGGITASKRVCPDNQHGMPPSSVKASSKKWCRCFSCSSSCSCCLCCACAFCC